MAVCQNVYLSGELVGTIANEQALILETSQGLVVIVGCSPPVFDNTERQAQH